MVAEVDVLVRRCYVVFGTVLMVAGFTSCGIQKSLQDRPDISAYTVTLPEKHTVNDSTFTQGKNSLLKNKYGLWELYLEGNPLERGLANGSLTKDLYYRQERVFWKR
tara:strand:- start:11870 stop:12190 length:321 start_codon:yes stop_codon:yes gene_type:complete